MTVLWAYVRANIWCLFHFGDCVYTSKISDDKIKWTLFTIEVGRGSIAKKTWVTKKVFYKSWVH